MQQCGIQRKCDEPSLLNCVQSHQLSLAIALSPKNMHCKSNRCCIIWIFESLGKEYFLCATNKGICSCESLISIKEGYHTASFWIVYHSVSVNICLTYSMFPFIKVLLGFCWLPLTMKPTFRTSECIKQLLNICTRKVAA